VPTSTNRIRYPADHSEELQRLGDATLACLEEGDLAGAKEAATAQLRLIEQAEQSAGHALHKGQALFNIASAESGRSVDGARAWFLAAFVEDARLQARAPLQSLAARTLSTLYEYMPQALRAIADRARKEPDLDPVRLGMLLSIEGTSEPLRLPFPEHADESVLDSAGRRALVFVGGSYRYEWPHLITLARGVVQAGFVPIVVRTFRDRPGEKNRAKSFRILDRCGSAIFDGSGVVSEGWIPELEHIAQMDTPIPTAIARAEDREGRTPNYSTMVPGTDEIPGLREVPFRSDEQLRADVARWLAEAVSLPAAHAKWRPQGPQYTSIGSATAAGSNTSFTPVPGRPWPDFDPPTIVGSGGDYGFVEDPTFTAKRDAEMWAERIKQGKTNRLGPTIPVVTVDEGFTLPSDPEDVPGAQPEEE
jgi:hypothetical protein